MRKDYKKFIFGFILGGFLFGSMGVVALDIYANEVKYSNTEMGNDITNTEQALDKLYQLAQSSQANIVELGSIGSDFDLTSYEGYTDFTIENNFFVIPTKIAVSVTNTYTHVKMPIFVL